MRGGLQAHEDADRLEKGGFSLGIPPDEDRQIRGEIQRQGLEAPEVHEAQGANHAGAFPAPRRPSTRIPQFPLENDSL